MRRTTTTVALLCTLLVLASSACSGLVLCIGPNGHLALEPVHGHCAHSPTTPNAAVLGTLPPALDGDSCLDVPISAAPAERWRADPRRSRPSMAAGVPSQAHATTPASRMRIGGRPADTTAARGFLSIPPVALRAWRTVFLRA